MLKSANFGLLGLDFGPLEKNYSIRFYRDGRYHCVGSFKTKISKLMDQFWDINVWSWKSAEIGQFRPFGPRFRPLEKNYSIRFYRDGRYHCVGSFKTKISKLMDQFLRKWRLKFKKANFDQKMAAKSPKTMKSKIWKKRLEILGHSTFCQSFGKIHQRSSEILLLTTDGRTTDGRRRTTDGRRTDAGRRATTIGYRIFDPLT